MRSTSTLGKGGHILYVGVTMSGRRLIMDAQYLESGKSNHFPCRKPQLPDCPLAYRKSLKYSPPTGLVE